ncbi:YciI family protein [Salinarimonas soli]|uniref:YciI family protein n=1 Tax=Salinarimonas soli TaxID=1638099 RepID=A0A5B2VDC0_9HYPH|nr:YciI family protein [Salinarimonas soli]KAA2236738.1 YciI family protein [Salinarimonas soli]
MKYMLMIYEDERAYGPEKAGAVLDAVAARHGAFAAELGPVLVGGAGLKGTPTATTVRAGTGARTIHDGPFAETKEQLGGFYLVDVPDLDAAIAVARRVPLVGEGAVEIRPVLQADDAR